MPLDLARRASAAAISAVLFAPSAAAETVTEPECFDTLVSARVVGQTPSVPPECDDCLIMRWPWFIDLKVKRVVKGEAVKGRLTVLTLQHAYIRPDLGPERWWLRRNSDGGFNVVYPGDEDSLPRCTQGAKPMTPFISPAEGQTLDDLRRAGQRMFGDGPR